MGKNENLDEEMTVELNLEDGTTVVCAIITILDVDGQDYIVLLPLDENGDINSVVLEAHFNLQVVFYYTNITFTEKQKENLVKLYDLLKGSGLMDAVIDAIGFDSEEYYDSYRGCKNTATELMQNKYSARGIMEDIVTNYNTINFDTAEIQKNIADPNNLALLKDILTKLG